MFKKWSVVLVGVVCLAGASAVATCQDQDAPPALPTNAASLVSGYSWEKEGWDFRDPMTEMVEGLFDSPEAARQIEMSAEQREQLLDLIEQRIKWPDDDRAKHSDYKSWVRARDERFLAEVRKILLPPQYQRLKQLAVNEMQTRLGTARMLSGEWFRGELGITDEQLAKIKERAALEKKKLDELIAKATREAADNILAELTPEQRKKMDEMFGDQ